MDLSLVRTCSAFRKEVVFLFTKNKHTSEFSEEPGTFWTLCTVFAHILTGHKILSPELNIWMQTSRLSLFWTHNWIRTRSADPNSRLSWSKTDFFFNTISPTVTILVLFLDVSAVLSYSQDLIAKNFAPIRSQVTARSLSDVESSIIFFWVPSLVELFAFFLSHPDCNTL